MQYGLIQKTITAIRKIINDDYPHERPDVIRTKKFARKYKTLLTTICRDKPYNVVQFSGNWRDASGFISNPTTGKHAYLSVGYGPLDSWKDRVMIRRVNNLSDYNGLTNSYCTIYELEDKLDSMLL